MCIYTFKHKLDIFQLNSNIFTMIVTLYKLFENISKLLYIIMFSFMKSFRYSIKYVHLTFSRTSMLTWWDTLEYGSPTSVHDKKKVFCSSPGPAAPNSCWSTAKAAGLHKRFNTVIHRGVARNGLRRGFWGCKSTGDTCATVI